MKLSITLLLFIVSLCTTTTAQELKIKKNVKITWGEEIKMKKDSYYDEVLYANESTICLSKFVKGNFYLELQNSKLVPQKEVEIELKHNKKDLNLEGIFEFGENLILMASRSNKKTKINTLFYKTIEKKTLKDKSDWIILSEISFLKKRRDGYFSYTLSDDEEKLLIYISQPYDGDDSPEKFGFKVFDKSMEMLWEKDVKLKYNEDLFVINDFIISNMADVYVIGRKLIHQDDKPKRISDYQYHILSYTYDNNNQDYQIELDEKYIKDITFGFNKKGNLVCGGLYSENGIYSSGIKGVFYVSIDTESGEIIQNSSKELDEGFITQDWSDRYKEKVEKKKAKAERKGKKAKQIEAYEFDLKDFIISDDGSATLLAEQYYVKVVTHTHTDANGNRRTTTTYHYYYNDIFIIKINQNGEIEWTSKIDKYQHSINDGGYRSSYHLHAKDDKLYLIYNLSTRAYYDREVWKSLPKNERKNYLTLISTVYPDGEIKDELLLDNSKEEIYMVPKYCEQIDNEKSFLYTSKRKNIRLGVLEFKD